MHFSSLLAALTHQAADWKQMQCKINAACPELGWWPGEKWLQLLLSAACLSIHIQAALNSPQALLSFFTSFHPLTQVEQTVSVFLVPLILWLRHVAQALWTFLQSRALCNRARPAPLSSSTITRA